MHFIERSFVRPEDELRTVAPRTSATRIVRERTDRPRSLSFGQGLQDEGQGREAAQPGPLPSARRCRRFRACAPIAPSGGGQRLIPAAEVFRQQDDLAKVGKRLIVLGLGKMNYDWGVAT